MSHNRRTIAVLIAAGLAYAWNHRERLSEQLRSLTGRSGEGAQPERPRYALPDLSTSEIRDFSAPAETEERDWERARR
jgi:hypothetical protein